MRKTKALGWVLYCPPLTERRAQTEQGDELQNLLEFGFVVEAT